MNEKDIAAMRERYLGGDSAGLFRYILSITGEIPMDEALECLESMVIKKRKAWIEATLPGLTLSDDPVEDAYRVFYRTYLGVSLPEHGELAEKNENRWVMNWWNGCPVLDICRELNLDTRHICRKVYHGPVQMIFSHIHPQLHFDRNYRLIRPYAPYCQEIIWLEKQGGFGEGDDCHQSCH